MEWLTQSRRSLISVFLGVATLQVRFPDILLLATDPCPAAVHGVGSIGEWHGLSWWSPVFYRFKLAGIGLNHNPPDWILNPFVSLARRQPD